MDGTEPMTTQISPAALQAYQYKIARSRRELEKMQRKLDERKATADASSERRANLSRHTRTSGDSHRDSRARARSRLAGIPEAERENLIQNLDMSFAVRLPRFRIKRSPLLLNHLRYSHSSSIMKALIYNGTPTPSVPFGVD